MWIDQNIHESDEKSRQNVLHIIAMSTVKMLNFVLSNYFGAAVSQFHRQHITWHEEEY